MVGHWPCMELILKNVVELMGLEHEQKETAEPAVMVSDKRVPKEAKISSARNSGV